MALQEAGHSEATLPYPPSSHPDDPIRTVTLAPSSHPVCESDLRLQTSAVMALQEAGHSGSTLSHPDEVQGSAQQEASLVGSDPFPSSGPELGPCKRRTL